jgi:hypothetical protein
MDQWIALSRLQVRALSCRTSQEKASDSLLREDPKVVSMSA